MEVKNVYLDLQQAEPKKKWWKTVRKLESEAFKDPLEIQIEYDDKELKEFSDKVNELKVDLNNKDSKIHELDAKLDATVRTLWDHKTLMETEHKNIESLVKFLSENESEIKSLYKVVANAKTMVDSMSEVIIKQQERIDELEKKITKQPMVFSDTTFISGHERVGLTIIDVPSGDYLVIAKYVVMESNEYVENQNDIIFEKVTVNDWHYIPMYQLVGWTELDTPTATIYRDLILIPC